jgi:hypothetical protein
MGREAKIGFAAGTIPKEYRSPDGDMSLDVTP